MPLHLILDTGSPIVSVAAARNGTVLAHRAVAMERSSTQLLKLIDEVLSEAGVRPADLEGVAALRGPGSFTGLRIGLATVLGFHQALGIPATALDTLRVLAGPHPPGPPLPSPPLPPGEGGRREKGKQRNGIQEGGGAPLPDGGGAMGEGSGVRLAVVDALRGDWSAQAFATGPVPMPLSEMTLVSGADLPALAQAAGPNAAVIGFGVSRLAELPGWPSGLQLIEAPPLAVTAARLAADPSIVWDPSLLTSPLYARPPAITQPRPRTAQGHASPV